ncbi:MAG: hypothetical protein Q9227_001553 [Pyrenula ochraceoflavens]
MANSVVYSRNCHNKIEDLAILTGDQAFCANCFKCRNCKKKIENLRYARTSQGIFCMDCHESLMARRRKKTARNNAQRQKAQNQVHLDKSLPSLPPTAAPEPPFSPELDIPSPDPYADQVTEIPPRKRPTERRQGSSGRIMQEDSPSTNQHQFRGPVAPNKSQIAQLTNQLDGLTLPPNSLRNKRHSAMSQRSDASGNGDEFLIPLAFDPTPPAAQTPQMPSQKASKITEERPRDYFSTPRGASSNSHRNAMGSSSQSSSPHIAYQEKDPTAPSDSSDTLRRRREIGNHVNGSIPMSKAAREGGSDEKFKLQDVPRGKRSGASSEGSRSESVTPRSEAVPFKTGLSEDRRRNGNEVPSNLSASDAYEPSPRPSTDSTFRSKSSLDAPSEARPLGSSSISSSIQLPPRRGDSLESSRHNHVLPRKEVTQANSSMEGIVQDRPERHADRANKKSESPPTIDESNVSHSVDLGRAKPPHEKPSQVDPAETTFTSPRTAPPPPPTNALRHRNESFSTTETDKDAVRNLENLVLPRVQRDSTNGGLSMEEDMARIWAGEDGQSQESFLRRVSNSVKHGRSFSDKGARLSKEPRGPRSPTFGAPVSGQDISSPSIASPEHKDELAWFKNELRKERQKNMERDQKIQELEAALGSTANINKVDSELREKRSTMVVLDSQKEIVVRELETLTEHIAEAKKSGEPINLAQLNNAVLRDFAASLQKLKDSFAPQIEDSIQQRNDLVDEISKLTQMKDKSFQEFEQLSLKNAQLAELNNQLVHQIQELYKAANAIPNTEASKPPNGLGIYQHHKEKSQVSIDGREARPNMNEMSLPGSQTTIQQEEAEPVTVIQGPQMVNIRKGAQPRKFNWKKGGSNMAMGVKKGLKGAFTSTQQSYNREMQFAETGSYSSTSINTEPPYRQGSQDPPRQGFGFFSGQKPAGKGSKDWRMQANGSSTALIGADASTTLFGSDLEQRADFEKSPIPGIVSRCIEEVELRGMDVEGIYRKSGGNSQIQSVKEGFERSPHAYDISDPDLDIHAVTSSLKQYFRKLPTPLITYDVYDKLLDSINIPSPDARVQSMSNAILDLPKVHRDVLEFLVFHLKRVVDRELENLMTSMNVAVVFAPTIMRPESLSREMTDTQKKNEAVQFLVENCQAIFMSVQ